MNTPLLSVRALGVAIPGPGPARLLLEDVAFDLGAGEGLGVVGASGAGKSTLGLALLRLLPTGATFTAGSSIRMGADELTALDGPALRALRGRRIAHVPQEPLPSLDPAMRIGDQLVEALRAHGVATGVEATERAEATLAMVGIPHPRRATRQFPHEFSGGMRQRALIAAAVVLEPALIVADEPTTALDPTVQAQVLDLLEEIRRRTGSALLLISHDLDVVGERCDRVIVLDGGRVVETGATHGVMRAPASEAGRRLVAARRQAVVPADPAPTAAVAPTLIEVRDVWVRYALRDRIFGAAPPAVEAVRGVSLDISRGEVLGLVGESGCGKSSFARALLRLGPLTSGSVHFDGRDLSTVGREELRQLRRRIQFIPQDAGASLTPHRTVRELVAEPIEAHRLAEGRESERRVEELLDQVELPARARAALPDRLSSGERQRTAIARALSLGPELLVCDEPVASVDAATRGHLLRLFASLHRERALSMLLISHDLAAVRELATRIAVMYLGRVVEVGPSEIVGLAPQMPYMKALLAAEPTGDPAARAGRATLAGDVDISAPEVGCPFRPRCAHPSKDEMCGASRPMLRPVGPGHLVACFKA